MRTNDSRSPVLAWLLAGGVALLGLAAVAVAPSAPAPQQSVRPDTTRPWQWPEHAENLQVLPDETTAEQLRNTMFAFTSALGVRCHHCHVGEEGRPFNQWDFASDEKPAKEAARVMMRMVKAINDDHLSELDTPAAERIAVRCQTCHRGVPRPMPLEDALSAVLAEKGLDAALAEYAALRQRFFGGSAYDFRAGSLESLAQRLLGSQQADAALAFLQLNTEHNPGSARTERLFGDVYVSRGDTATALTHLRRAAELDPQNTQIRQRLQQLGGQ